MISNSGVIVDVFFSVSAYFLNIHVLRAKTRKKPHVEKSRRKKITSLYYNIPSQPQGMTKLSVLL